MDTNKKNIDREPLALLLSSAGVAIGLLLSKTPERQTCPPYIQRQPRKLLSETLPAATQAPETEETTEGRKTLPPVFLLPLRLHTSGKVSSSILRWTRWDDTSKKDKINELLKANALSFIKANDTTRPTIPGTSSAR